MLLQVSKKSLDYRFLAQIIGEGTTKLPEGWVLRPDGRIDVQGDVDLSNKNLTSLPYKFGVVTGDFYCAHNKLTSLVGAPQKVGGNFSCHSNQLTSLEGGPKFGIVTGNFYCDNNQLTSLKGAPQKVGGDFDCSDNQLRSWRYLPKCGNRANMMQEIRKQMTQYLVDLGYKRGTKGLREALKALEEMG